MSKEYELFPYKGIGRLLFGMTRDEVRQIMGQPVSSVKYGFPVADGILEDHGFIYTLFSSRDALEAVEFFPEYTVEELIWSYGGVSISLSDGREAILEELNRLTDDVLQEEDEPEGYYSQKLGIKFWCPDDEDEVASLVVHDAHCYDAEEQYLKELANNGE